jgi:hypothetical protein
MQKAQALAVGATLADRALIEALRTRYKGPEPVDPPTQQPFNVAFGEGMREVAARFPDDLDVQTLFAESLMNTNPWKLWTLEGKPSPVTEEIVATLERVLARNPNHPGANHYYIHAVEASPHPEKALASAKRLETLAPSAGHLVHMPAHTYSMVGLWAQSVASNTKSRASAQDQAARTWPGATHPSEPHHLDFMEYALLQMGQEQRARQIRDDSNAIKKLGFEFMPSYTALAAVPARFALALTMCQMTFSVMPLPQIEPLRLTHRKTRPSPTPAV